MCLEGLAYFIGGTELLIEELQLDGLLSMCPPFHTLRIGVNAADMMERHKTPDPASWTPLRGRGGRKSVSLDSKSSC